MKTTPEIVTDAKSATAPAVASSDLLSIVVELIEQMKDQSHWVITGVVGPAQVAGKRQDNKFFGHEYVDQSGPGISGDDYQGHIYLPVEGKYIQVWFAS